MENEKFFNFHTSQQNPDCSFNMEENLSDFSLEPRSSDSKILENSLINQESVSALNFNYFSPDVNKIGKSPQDQMTSIFLDSVGSGGMEGPKFIPPKCAIFEISKIFGFLFSF